MVDIAAVKEALRGVLDPELKKSLLELGMIRDLAINRGTVSLS